MDRKTLEQRLTRYRADQARAEYLRRYIPLMEKRLAVMKEDALRGLGAARPLNGIRAVAGPGDPTGQLAVRAAENALTEEMRLCRDRLHQLKRECAALEAQLGLTDFLLSSLTEESRFLLTERLIHRVRWQELPQRYQERYGIDYSVVTLRRRVGQALDTLCGTCERAG